MAIQTTPQFDYFHPPRDSTIIIILAIPIHILLLHPLLSKHKQHPQITVLAQAVPKRLSARILGFFLSPRFYSSYQ